MMGFHFPDWDVASSFSYLKLYFSNGQNYETFSRKKLKKKEEVLLAKVNGHICMIIILSHSDDD